MRKGVVKSAMKRRGFLSTAVASVTGWLAARKASGGQSPKSARTPSSSPTADEITWRRKVPVRYDADVAIIGGGIAGVCAAAAAARSGAKVILVERFAVTGGMLTSGGVANFCDAVRGGAKS